MLFKYMSSEDDGLYEHITNGIVKISHQVSKYGNDWGNYKVSEYNDTTIPKIPISNEEWLKWKKTAQKQLELEKEDIEKRIKMLKES